MVMISYFYFKYFLPTFVSIPKQYTLILPVFYLYVIELCYVYFFSHVEIFNPVNSFSSHIFIVVW